MKITDKKPIKWENRYFVEYEIKRKNGNIYSYKAKCNVLCITESGKVKIMVNGDKSWNSSDDLYKIRYVNSNQIYEQ